MDARLEPHVLFNRADIEKTVSRLASEIARDYRDKHPILVGILKGSFMFMADLIRCLDFPLEVEFIQLSSYGRGTQTSGRVKVLHGLKSPIKDRHILVIEDIIDTGLTTSFLLDYLKRRKPATLRLCCLLDKPARRQVPVTIDYLGFTVPNKFIVGYGIDFSEKFRNLPEIGFIEVKEC